MSVEIDVDSVNFINTSASITTTADGSVSIQTGGTASGPAYQFVFGKDGSLGTAVDPLPSLVAKQVSVSKVPVSDNDAVNKKALDAAIKSVSTSTTPTTGADWVAPALLNGWANNGNTGTRVQPNTAYRKDDSRHVELKGLLTNTANPNNNNIFQLPVGFRPPYQCQFIVTGSSQFGIVKVNPDGYVLCAASDGYVQLTGIRFPIDS